jgi:glycosyltransferase involved in cell wall biosynthesis
MSSGLVPVTNRVAAVPEFVDERCGMLVEAEDYRGLAEAVAKLYHDRGLFLRLSAGASEQVRRQSGPGETIEKELELLGQA